MKMKSSLKGCNKSEKYNILHSYLQRNKDLSKESDIQCNRKNDGTIFFRKNLINGVSDT